MKRPAPSPPPSSGDPGVCGGVTVLDPGDGRAQKIGRAIASPLAGEILQDFTGGPRTLSAVADALRIPLNTAKYHVENLVAADLLGAVDVHPHHAGGPRRSAGPGR